MKLYFRWEKIFLNWATPHVLSVATSYDLSNAVENKSLRITNKHTDVLGRDHHAIKKVIVQLTDFLHDPSNAKGYREILHM